jgi:proteasome lid subunit RPN8/RPN11
MSAPLRVNFSRRAYGELTGHAKESLEAEVGGVLVGTAGEDEEGAFVDVRATIRGSAAREARAQVTFTHETWNQIHTTLDRDFPDLQIVGWYHTHPGFGVEFSAMDRFIQENFFSGKTQVAFLTDPLGGDVSLACNGSGGLEYLPRFRVDGREHAARVPAAAGAGATAAAGAGSAAAAGGEVRSELERLETRVNQLVRALDEQRTLFHRVMLTMLVVVCVAVIGGVGYAIWADRYDRIKPPEAMSFAPMPVKVGNETVLLGVQVVRWNVPPRLDALYDRMLKLELEERLRLLGEIEELQHEQQRRQPPPRQRPQQPQQTQPPRNGRP